MWKEVLLNYSIFLLELLTVFGVVATVIMLILTQRKQAATGEIVLENLSEKYQQETKSLKQFFLSEEQQKHTLKAEKKAQKEKAKAEKKQLKSAEQPSESEAKARLFVLNFHGDLNASAVSSLTEEINAVLTLADPKKDEVVVKLESLGGVVHGYGLAASQLQRLKDKAIPLTIAVDKVAASGGYMMACVADKIVAAPFAILGSIGVVAQVPNIHRLLKKHDIDVDVMTAGEYKRTVTLVGENTEKGKQKFQQELDETHILFKQFVAEHRPQLEIDKVATGEHWFGQQALTLNLVDEISTSDEVILNAINDKEVVSIKYLQKKSLTQRLSQQVEQSIMTVIAKLLNKSRSPML